MSTASRYLAFFDLLGTQNLSGNAKEYYEKITQLQERIIDNSAYLKRNDNISKIAFFSDSCYVESKNLYDLTKYISVLRDDLSTIALYFNAAIIKFETDDTSLTFDSIKCDSEEESCSICGTMFLNNSVANAYVEQNRFKGIGILLSKEVYEDAKKDSRIKISNSIYLSNHEKRDSAVTYKDIATPPPSSILQNQWLNEIVKSYYFACSNSPRYGKYYISLFTNIINSSSSKLEWDLNQDKFINSDSIYNVVYKMIINQNDFLVGMDIISIVFINKILSSNLLQQDKYNIIFKLLNNKNSIVNKFLNNLDAVPWCAFFGNKNNEEEFRRYCQEYIINSKLEDILQ